MTSRWMSVEVPHVHLTERLFCVETVLLTRATATSVPVLLLSAIFYVRLMRKRETGTCLG